ncbi:MAG: hypothetical protein IVW54_05895 [Candidatus Binataceae bacterium]|nr:hypothetical protein [Candidatus Binataceae bacterium]
MNRRLILGLLLLATLVRSPIASSASNAASTHHPRVIRLRVDSVMAANTEEGMDDRLSHTPMAPRLKALFEYTTYRLIVHQEKLTVCGRMVAFELPGGRILHIAPRAVDGDMISMELVLFEGPRPVMSTDLKLMNHALLIVGGPRYEQGMLITTIRTDAPASAAESAVQHAADSSTAADAAPATPPSPPTPAGPVPAESSGAPQP